MTTPARILADAALQAYARALSNVTTLLEAEQRAHEFWRKCAGELGSNAPQTVQARNNWELAFEQRGEHAQQLKTCAEDLSATLRGVEMEGPDA
ncbi:hypothetical protein [Archangium sp.]|uniref:hypothetical protein n=1 Tax=Archangium sp. TaxID=1872627 RepID=UPI00286A7EEB|nr:hypothetical protein [Archangium sp.]